MGKGAVDNTAAPIARDSAVREGRVAIKSVNHGESKGAVAKYSAATTVGRARTSCHPPRSP